MSVTAELTFPADTFTLGRVLRTEHPVDIELARAVPVGGQDGLYFWADADDDEAFEAAVRDDQRVDALVRHDDAAERTLYRISLTPDSGGAFEFLGNNGLLLEEARGAAEEWTVRVRAPDRDQLLAFHTTCRDRGRSLQVDWISESDPPTGRDGPPGADRGLSDGTVDDRPRRGVATRLRESGGDWDRETFRENAGPFRDVVDHLDEVVWVSDPDKEEMFYVNPAYRDVWGQPRERLYEYPMSFLDAVVPEDRDRVEAALESQVRGEYDEQYRIEQPDGTIRCIRDRAVPIRNERGEVELVAGIAEDVTEYEERGQMLTGLNESSPLLLRADTKTEIAEHVVDAASETLDLSLVSVYLFDESTEELRPVAEGPDVAEVLGDLPRFSSGSLALEAFVTGETKVYDDVRTEPGVYNTETPVRSELIVPLRDHGVLLAGDTRAGIFDADAAEFAELLATNVAAALDRVERERRIRCQNERLRDLSRLNTAIRSINQAIVNASTREEIERTVCERLLVVGSYTVAVVAEYQSRHQHVHVRNLAGRTAERSPEAPGTVDTDTAWGAMVRTAQQTGGVDVVQDFERTPDTDPSDTGFGGQDSRALAAVPLQSGEANYGVLIVGADEPNPFDEEEIAILKELGKTIGQAIRAAETRKALVAETAVELEFEFSNADSFFIAASEQLECTFTLEGIVPTEASELLAYVTVDGASPADVSERMAESSCVRHHRLVTETDGGGLFEFHVAGASAVLALVDYGATVRSAVADNGEARVTAEVAPDADIQTIDEGLQSVCPGATLVGKQQLARPVETVQQFRQTFLEMLTDRQLNALQAAFFGGYFEWPRESTAEEIADAMDISSSTFHFHLRRALNKALTNFFETRSRE